MKTSLLAAGWGLVLLGSFVGWGAVTNRLIDRDRPAAAGLRLTWGLALLAAIGGPLNAAALISPALIAALTAIGLLALAAGRPSRSWAGSLGSLGPAQRAVAVALTAAAALYYVGGLAALPSWRDDYGGYFVLVRRMLEAGTLGDDPFNAHRLEAGLGGNAFLLAFLGCAAPDSCLGLLDAGVGRLGLVLTLGGMARRLGLSATATLGLLAVGLYLPLPAPNVSAHLLAIVMLLGLHETLAWADAAPDRPARNAAMIALVAAGLAGLKSTLIPGVACVLGLSYVSLLAGAADRRRVMRELCLVAILTAALLAPWMQSLHHSSGTWLYPLLGDGDHGSRYGTVAKPYAARSVPQLVRRELSALSNEMTVALAVLGALAIPLVRGRSPRQPLAALVVGSLIAVVALSLVFDPRLSLRYVVVFSTAATLAATAVLLGPDAAVARRRAAVLVALGFLVGGQWSVARWSGQRLAGRLAVVVRGRRIETPELIRAHRALQAAIPPGAPVLARLQMASLLDFGRNPIQVVEYPGETSPPPGLPIGRGSEAVVEFLLARGLRYLAYTYLGPDGRPASRAHPTDATVSPWERDLNRCSLDFDRNVHELCRTREHRYDDGRLIVLDLAARAAPGRAGPTLPGPIPRWDEGPDSARGAGDGGP
jgi:hypothetical protein